MESTKKVKKPKVAGTVNRGVALKAIDRAIKIEQKECDKKLKKATADMKKSVAAEKKAAKDGKVKRPPSAYNLFVKEHYQDPDIQSMAPNVRLKEIAKKWKVEKMR